MLEARNPFRLRSSEYIESDETFLRLFAPRALDVLEDIPRETLFKKILVFCSSPGGGKTSILRLFTPSCLLSISRHQTSYNDLYKFMIKQGLLTEDEGPRLLALKLDFSKIYVSLNDLGFDSRQTKILFYKLLSCRLILSLLQNLCVLKGLNYPEDLDKFSIAKANVNQIQTSSRLPIPGLGEELYKWARNEEEEIIDIVDSFTLPSLMETKGFDGMEIVSLLQPDRILFNNASLGLDFLVMLDNVDQLTPDQRDDLYMTLLKMRPPVGFWLAERLEALNPKELLDAGATTGREYLRINLEREHWKNPKSFEKVLSSVADRRVDIARDVEIKSFEHSLEINLDEDQWKVNFEKASKDISEKMKKRAESREGYLPLIQEMENTDNTPQEKAIRWKIASIKVERHIKRPQQDFGFSPATEINAKELDKVKEAAEFFVCVKNRIPYYFGMPRLAKISSNNIDQFLEFAGDLFEVIISEELSKISKVEAVLGPEFQERIIKKVAQRRWEEISRRVANANDVRKFLEAVANFARKEIDNPRASYAPGITGIALTSQERMKLITSKLKEHRRLALVISSCVMHNLFELRPDTRQGAKGNLKWVFYLNRLFCVHFGLTINYGGWRTKSVDELCQWLVNPGMQYE